jgi:hypothetical protein
VLSEELLSEELLSELDDAEEVEEDDRYPPWISTRMSAISFLIKVVKSPVMSASVSRRGVIEPPKGSNAVVVIVIYQA